MSLPFASMMTSSQCSGQSGSSCGANSAGYSPWGPAPHQYATTENFYNNPVQYPNNGSNGSVQGPHRYQITPTTQPPPPSGYYHPQQANRAIHPHYPPSHAHSADYQSSYHHNNRKCGNARSKTHSQPPLLKFNLTICFKFQTMRQL